ncbi:hypothetical protein H4684_003190 [Desulfomicrobium macestii]|uniref:MITD1 C-terminal phospholipase D-like domain-containing protein n=1 Tax=Desulfomicrobium macestii TaxID=90731 RepID=A0ABR9H754_9BACT|nr:MIT C-terminal domain-containing protein [Desulfomicrobium macestii]MBE1426524.1 hypothetical protein [Desulfomicrobium macestii]
MPYSENQALCNGNEFREEKLINALVIAEQAAKKSNGWVIKIGRGLDFYQKPGGWYELGATDLSLRKCLETKVDIYRLN